MKWYVKYGVVLSIITGIILFSGMWDNFSAWADDGICDPGDPENLLTIFHGGENGTQVPDEDEIDPGAFTMTHLPMRLVICKPEVSDASPEEMVTLDVIAGKEKIVLLDQAQENEIPPSQPFPLAELPAIVWVKPTQSSEQEHDIRICAKFQKECQDVVTATALLNLEAHWPGTLDDPGEIVSEAEEDNSLNLIGSVNDDDDNDDDIIDNDREQSPSIVAEDDDVMTFIVRKLGPEQSSSDEPVFQEGTLELFAGDGLHVFTADGMQELTLPLSVDLANPSGPLANVLYENVTLLVEANIPVERTMVELIYSQNGKEMARDEVHLKVVQPTVKGGFTRGSVRYSEAMNLGGKWVVFREFDDDRPISVLLPDPFGETADYQHIWYRKDPRETGYTQEWKTDGRLSDPQYFDDLAQQWNEILDRFNIPAPRYTADDIARQLSLKLGISADVLKSGRYFITGLIEDTGHYEITLLDQEQNLATAHTIRVNVMKPGQIGGQFRIIGEPNAPYFREESLANVSEDNQLFFRTLGGMRLHLTPEYAIQFKAYEPYLVKYEWCIAQEAEFAFPDAIFTQLTEELREEQHVPEAIITALEIALKGKTFLSQDDLIQAIQPAFENGYTITRQVLEELKSSVDEQFFPSYFCGEDNTRTQVCANHDGLCVLQDISYNNWEAFVEAARAATFLKNGDPQYRHTGYHLAGYRVSKQALNRLLFEEVIPHQNLPFTIYDKLLRRDDERTICDGNGHNACIRGTAGEGYSFRYTTAAGENTEMTTVLQKALEEDYAPEYEEIIAYHADHIRLFFERDTRIKEAASHQRYLPQARETILKYGAAGVEPDGDFFRDYTTTREVIVGVDPFTHEPIIELSPPLTGNDLKAPYDRFALTADVFTGLEAAGMPEALVNQLRSLEDTRYATEEELIAAVEVAVGSALTQQQHDLLVIHAAWLPTIFWEGKARPDIDEMVTLLLTFGEEHENGDIEIIGTVPITRQITSRVLELKNPLMTGDDVSMLQMVLRQFGQSQSAGMGYVGDAVKITNSFSENTNKALNRLRYQDELANREDVDNNTPASTSLEVLLKIGEHWKDYLRAFEAYPDTPNVRENVPSEAEFETWVEHGANELAKTYTNKYVAEVEGFPEDEVERCDEARRDLIRAWVTKEASKGHWGFLPTWNDKFSYRIVLGGADEMGSIGFSQIQSRHKYGGTSSAYGGFNGVNLYHPAEGVKGFAIFSNNVKLKPSGGAGFYFAFSDEAGNDSYHKEINYADGGIYPRIGDIYIDNAEDRLSKGIMAYNRGSGLSDLKTLPWPEILRKFLPPNDNTPRNKKQSEDPGMEGWSGITITRWAINYALTVKKKAGFSLQERSWIWTTQRIVSKDAWLSDINNEQIESDILLVEPGTMLVEGQILVVPGDDGKIDTEFSSFSEEQLEHIELQEFSFDYTEEDWWYDETKKGEANGKKGIPWLQKLSEESVK